MSPWMSERAESSTHGSRWCEAGIVWIKEQCLPKHGSRWCGAGIMWMRECPLHTAAADVGLVSCEWESVLYTRQPLMWGWYRVNKRSVSSNTRQPLMWGWYHVNESVSSTHGRPLMRGWYHVNESVLYTRQTADEGLVSCEWERVLYTRQTADEGLVSCEWVGSQVIVLCTRQSAALRRGAACLDSVPCGICGDIGTLTSSICTRLSAPPWKGDVRSRADVLSCRFDGWEECGHLVGMSSSPESRSTADRGQTDSS